MAGGAAPRQMGEMTEENIMFQCAMILAKVGEAMSGFLSVFIKAVARFCSDKVSHEGQRLLVPAAIDDHIDVPQGARVIDVTGRIVAPGFYLW